MRNRHHDGGSRPHWQTLSDRFAGERECLASYLALEAAEVLEGEKPANLISLPNRTRACGRNLYQLWERHGICLLRQGGLSVLELKQSGNSVLLLIYHPEALASLLARKNTAAFLRRAGYRDPISPAGALAELGYRFANGGFPHEIGVFLGYPLKDVAGFLGWAPLPFACQGPWKIYGNPAMSLDLAETYRQCRCRMADRLASCASPLGCLKVGRPSGRSLSATAKEHSFLRSASCVSP